MLITGDLKELPRIIFACILFHYDAFAVTYSDTHIVLKAIKECLNIFGYSDAILRLWIATVRLDYTERNVAHFGANNSILSAAAVHEDLYKSLNSLHSKYDKVYLDTFYYAFIDSYLFFNCTYMQ